MYYWWTQHARFEHISIQLDASASAPKQKKTIAFIAFTAYTSAGYGRPAVIVLIALFFFESIMFPTIFVMDTVNLDRRTAGFLIMEVFGDAVFSSINYGFSCAESTNFALEHWIEYDKH
ncbi:unnamed protein product [Rotaria sp. Silwood2]|nr:unnamed protein product [Rotaria sp. Silwood2]CAF2996801.1 unnamed protein product [Rotaria sp. Silwood2]CAF3243764.1 unnamed protein product [Rotaria sp. Silwood2]CAF3340724.1 unnamed protein product [Rotaria sp. Silwood2]CAF4209032.1 unnamed protein product [Rotaria sp. Silwood2]